MHQATIKTVQLTTDDFGLAGRQDLLGQLARQTLERIAIVATGPIATGAGTPIAVAATAGAIVAATAAVPGAVLLIAPRPVVTRAIIATGAIVTRAVGLIATSAILARRTIIAAFTTVVGAGDVDAEAGLGKLAHVALKQVLNGAQGSALAAD